MARKLSPRAKFIQDADIKKLAAYAWDAMQLASTHDPEHSKELKELRKLIEFSHEQLSDEIIYNHNHLVGVIDKRISEARSKKELDKLK